MAGLTDALKGRRMVLACTVCQRTGIGCDVADERLRALMAHDAGLADWFWATTRPSQGKKFGVNFSPVKEKEKRKRNM